jgi:hypothetical protein
MQLSATKPMNDNDDFWAALGLAFLAVLAMTTILAALIITQSGRHLP